MVNAHCADAMVCISEYDKITPGMLNAAMRLNIPVVFVSGWPMEAGKTALSEHKLDLVDAIVVPQTVVLMTPKSRLTSDPHALHVAHVLACSLPTR